MKIWPKIRLGTVSRLSIGLLSLVLGLVVISDTLADFVSGRTKMEALYQKRISEGLSIQLVGLLEDSNRQILNSTLEQVVIHNPQILSLTLRKKDGHVVVQRGSPAGKGVAAESIGNHVRVPISQGAHEWGDIEITFAPTGPQGIQGWLIQPLPLMVAIILIGGFGLFYAYLSRSMKFLDPSAAVPDRVRKAYDALSEGIVILDSEERIVMANQTFRNLYPGVTGNLMGLKIPDLQWMQPALANLDKTAYPWTKAFRDSADMGEEPISLPQPEGPPREIIITCGPIANNAGQVRGCLVTFNDVTKLHQMNARLRSTLVELEQSRREIELKNEELLTQATRDPLTACYNRRYFFDAGNRVVEKALLDNSDLCCVMADIDFFKSFNDLYGHAIGDQVIKVVAKALASSLRIDDILCRYGGEEFCILLPNTTLDQTYMVADRIRAKIEKDAVTSIRATQPLKTITSSFGVANLTQGMKLEELIDRADTALYASKEGGRNRVTIWKPHSGLSTENSDSHKAH